MSDRDFPPPHLSGSSGQEAHERLLELVRLRVAMIHACPESVAHHVSLLRNHEEGFLLDELETWKTSSRFEPQERAALALCEQITLDPDRPLPECLIQEMRHHFIKEVIIDLTLAIMAANDWELCPGRPARDLFSSEHETP